MIKVSFETELRSYLFSLPAVPNVGETINIKGREYRVKERRWAIDPDGSLVCVILIEADND